MSVFLFKIEDVFEIEGRGLILAPTISTETHLPKSSKVSLISSNKDPLEAEASFEIPFFEFANIENYLKHKPAFVCILKDLPKDSIQIGMEVWLN